jgi:hypothetical protein
VNNVRSKSIRAYCLFSKKFDGLPLDYISYLLARARLGLSKNLSAEQLQ